jgi:hypothetical protein
MVRPIDDDIATPAGADERGKTARIAACPARSNRHARQSSGANAAFATHGGEHRANVGI